MLTFFFFFFFQFLPRIGSWRVNQKRIWPRQLIPWHDQIAVWGILCLLTLIQDPRLCASHLCPFYMSFNAVCHTFPSSTYTSVLSNSLPIDLFFPRPAYFLTLLLGFPPLLLSLSWPSIILFLFHLHFVIYLLFPGFWGVIEQFRTFF